MVAAVIPQREEPVPVAQPACITGTSAVVFGVLPILMGLFAEELRLGWQQIGWLGAIQQTGGLAGALLAYRIVGGRGLKAGILLASACAVTASLLSAWTHTFALLLAWQALAGASGACVFAIGTYLLGRTAVPERSFSLMFGVQVICSCAYAAVLPLIRLHFGYVLAVASVGIWFAGVFALGLTLPRGIAGASDPVVPAPSVRRAGRLVGTCTLTALTAFEMAAVAIWIYSERVGVRSGLADAQIGAAIAIGGLGGLPAAGLGTVLGNRLGHLPILILASLTVATGTLLILGQTAFSGYLAAQLILNFGWILGLSYYTGLATTLTTTGREIRLVPVAIMVAAGLGPNCVSLLGGEQNLMSIFVVSVFFCAAALLLALLAVRFGTASRPVEASIN